MDDEFGLTRFEQELVRHLRALPFHAQQHVSRYILKLQREHAVVPEDVVSQDKPGRGGSPAWGMTYDELQKIRDEIEGKSEG